MLPALSRSGPGVSSIVGRISITTAIAAMYEPAAASVAFHAPSRWASCRPRYTPPTNNTANNTTISRYNNVRWRMVSSRLTAGGFAGYFSAGTTYRLNNIPPATYSDRPRAETVPTRPYATANTTANSAPIATLNAITPKPRPMVALTARAD